jgi:hypothetical protein
VRILPQTYGVYRVTGKRQYRGHDPGTTFEAIIDPSVEHRAVNRGDIELLRRFTPDLVEGSFVLPDDWPPGKPSVPPVPTETPIGVSFIEGGGLK